MLRAWYSSNWYWFINLHWLTKWPEATLCKRNGWASIAMWESWEHIPRFQNKMFRFSTMPLNNWCAVISLGIKNGYFITMSHKSVWTLCVIFYCWSNHTCTFNLLKICLNMSLDLRWTVNVTIDLNLNVFISLLRVNVSVGLFALPSSPLTDWRRMYSDCRSSEST